MSEQKFKVNCGFFNSINHDRLYQSEDMNRPYKRLVGNGVFATPFGEPSTDMQVFTANDEMNIIVKKGEGIFNNKWFENPTDLKITVPKNNSIIPRIDSVIARVDMNRNTRDGAIVYVEGIENENPTPPEINTNEDIIEYRLANIYIEPNTNTILQENITDCRGSEECLWVTGLIKQVDTSTLFVQYQEWYKRVTGEAQTKLDNLETEFSDDFNTWFQTIQNVLDGDTVGNLLNLIYTKANKKKIYTIEIDTNWTGTEAPYTKTIEIEGITADDIPHLELIQSEIVETAISEGENFDRINKIVPNAGSVTLTCYEEKPEITLNTRIEVMN